MGENNKNYDGHNISIIQYSMIQEMTGDWQQPIQVQICETVASIKVQVLLGELHWRHILGRSTDWSECSVSLLSGLYTWLHCSEVVKCISIRLEVLHTYRTHCKSKSHDHILYIMHINSLWLLGICFTLHSVSSLKLRPFTTFCTQKRFNYPGSRAARQSIHSINFTAPTYLANELEVRDHPQW